MRKKYETNYVDWNSLSNSGRPWARLSGLRLHPPEENTGCRSRPRHRRGTRASVDSTSTGRTRVGGRNRPASSRSEKEFLARNYQSAPPESRVTHSPLVTCTALKVLQPEVSEANVSKRLF